MNDHDELIIDWDDLLDDDLNFDLGDLPPPDGLSMSPDSGCPFSVHELEHYLLNDEDRDGLADEFLADVLLDCFPESGLGPNDRSPLSGSESKRFKEPELVDAVTLTVEEEKEREKPQKNVSDVMQTRENCVVDNDGNADHDDPSAKKRKRQMRNRDAAVRSRERKKMYVRDLEMKSKYYEAECKRLGFLLQCCLAENQALRLSLHNTQAFDTSRTKQESAVLLLESLLLGSLLGFLGIICLLILPSQLLSTLKMSLVDNTECKSVAARKAGTKNLRSLFPSFMRSKRCKASRSRMKLGLFSTSVSCVGFSDEADISLFAY